ncbi:hypothetical protein [Granulicella sibirica]|uniref:Uncharacterized protein n=1 Tax=Granulicella sibirica TaxID=2479048 RepID=A0A4Q0T225_9BACT|nr:hypothetical protein [Granulicella sibirica]RXH55516.1 hypothetical protein GRAN_2373 [Granulicella sibirica]
MKTPRPETINQAIEDCRAAIAESEASLAAATIRASRPNAPHHEKLEALFYQQEIREMKKWLADAEQKRDSLALCGESMR